MRAIHVFCLMQTLFDSLEVMAQSLMVSDLMNIMNIVSHPLQGMFAEMKSAFSNRVIRPRCNRGCHWRSFLPTAIRLHNSSAVCMKHWLVLTPLPTTVCLNNCFTFALFITFSTHRFMCMMYFCILYVALQSLYVLYSIYPPIYPPNLLTHWSI